MKLKKIIYLSSMITLIIALIIFSCLISFKSINKKNNKVIIGNKITMDVKGNEYDDTFTFEYMSVSYLNKMLEIDASKIIDNKVKKLSNVLKESSLVIINIGSYDLKSVIVEDSLNTKLVYDLEVLNRQRELASSLINNIIKKVKMINDKTKIYLLKINYPYSILDKNVLEVFETLNESYQKTCEKFSVNYYKY